MSDPEKTPAVSVPIPPPLDTPSAPDIAVKQKRKTRLRSWWISRDTSDKINLLCTVINALGVIGAVVFSALVWRDTNQQGKENEAKARLELRPWMSVHEIKMDKPFSDSDPTEISIAVINKGRTPAFEVITNVSVSYGTTKVLPKNSPMYFTDMTEASRSTAASEAIEYSKVPIEPGKRLEAMKKLNLSLPVYVYVYGTIDYDDIFKEHHRTTFGYYHDIKNNSLNEFQILSTWNALN